MNVTRVRRNYESIKQRKQWKIAHVFLKFVSIYYIHMSGVCITPFTLTEAFRFDLFTHCSDILWKTE